MTMATSAANNEDNPYGSPLGKRNVAAVLLPADALGPYLWQFAPFNGRWAPLRVISPSCRTEALGTQAMCEHLQKMGAWTSQWAVGPMRDGYRIDVTELEWAFLRLDRRRQADELTVEYSSSADVFVTEMACDLVELWALKQGSHRCWAPTSWTTTTPRTTRSAISPNWSGHSWRWPPTCRATANSSGRRSPACGRHYEGLFAFGLDNVVVNVTKDRIWVRDAALPDATGVARAEVQWMIERNFVGDPPGQLTVANPAATPQEQSVRDLEIDPARFTPPDQMRPWARTAAAEFTIDPAQMIGISPRN